MHIKLPIGPIAKFALKRIVIPAIGRAVVSGDNPLTVHAAKDALQTAVEAEVARQVGKRVG